TRLSARGRPVRLRELDLRRGRVEASARELPRVRARQSAGGAVLRGVWGGAGPGVPKLQRAGSRAGSVLWQLRATDGSGGGCDRARSAGRAPRGAGREDAA